MLPCLLLSARFGGSVVTTVRVYMKTNAYNDWTGGRGREAIRTVGNVRRLTVLGKEMYRLFIEWRYETSVAFPCYNDSKR
jgi:hypothetical protein